MEAQSSDTVKLLSLYGADPAVYDGNRKNALWYFIEEDCLDAARAWLSAWLASNSEDKEADGLIVDEKEV
jgi:hypothetical protein